MAKAPDVDNSSKYAIVLSIIAIIGVGILFLGTGPTTAQTITVTATGTAYGYPDQASIYMSMNGTGNTPSAANQNLSATTSAVGTALAPFVGGNSSLIQTNSYNIYKGKTLVCTNVTRGPTISLPAPFYCNLAYSNSSSLYCCYNQTAYIATQSVMVTIPNINNVSAAFTSIASIPNVYSQSLSQGLSSGQSSMLLNTSLSSALANATSQAQILAGSQGSVVIGNISVLSGPSFYPAYFSNAAVSAGQSSGFFAGRVGVTRSVSVLFRIVKS